MSTTIRPDNLRAALDAKLAAATSQLIDLREAEQPRVTLHLSPREIVGTFLLHARSLYPIVDAFGRAQAGELQFSTWYQQWTEKLGDADRALWKRLRDRQLHAHGDELIDVEISVATGPAITAHGSPPGARPEVRKQLVRLAADPNRAASAVCGDYLRLATRFAHDFVRDHAQFLPK